MMSGKSYSDKANSNDSSLQQNGQNWAQAADNAAKKAEEGVEKLKREAQEQLNEGKDHNPS